MPVTTSLPELCHSAEPNHRVAFHELSDRVLPHWQHRKQRLERMMA
jgi:predicted metal-dependent hydrolase